MSRPSVILCCEGFCSDAYRLTQLETTRLRAAGYSVMEARGYLSSRLQSREHTFAGHQEHVGSQTRTLLYRCTGCGHVRAYGAEEL
jgi:hypothetical protein